MNTSSVERAEARPAAGLTSGDPLEGAVRVWVTRNAISDGVRLVECWDNKDGYVVKRGSYGVTYRLGVNAFLDRADAIRQAEWLRDASIASLQRRIAKLEVIDFGPAESGAGSSAEGRVGNQATDEPNTSSNPNQAGGEKL